MKKNNKKSSWEEIKTNPKVYMPEDKFIKVYNKTIRFIINKTNLQTAMLYLILFSHCNNQKNICYPDLETLAIESGVSKRTVQNMLKDLKDNKIIDFKSGVNGKCNNYSFPLEGEINDL